MASALSAFFGDAFFGAALTGAIAAASTRAGCSAAMRAASSTRYCSSSATGRPVEPLAAPLLQAEPLALTQSDILRALPSANLTLLTAVFLAADGAKYGAKDAAQAIAEDAQLQAMLNTLEAQL